MVEKRVDDIEEDRYRKLPKDFTKVHYNEMAIEFRFEEAKKAKEEAKLAKEDANKKVSKVIQQLMHTMSKEQIASLLDVSVEEVAKSA